MILYRPICAKYSHVQEVLVQVVRVGDYDPEAVAYLEESQPTRLMLGAVGLPCGFKVLTALSWVDCLIRQF